MSQNQSRDKAVRDGQAVVPDSAGPAVTPDGRPGGQSAFPGGQLTFMTTVRSEWIKFWSIRSTWVTLIVLVVVIIGFGLLMMSTAKAPPPGGTPVYVTNSVQLGLMLGNVVMAILAALTITNEYRSGEIRLSLLAVPNRWYLLGAKGLIVAVVAFVVSLVSMYVVVLGSWPFIRTFGVDDRFTADGIRVVVGAALAITLGAVMSLAIGALVRSTAAAVGIAVIILFVLPAVLGFIPVSWITQASHYTIANSLRGLASLPAQVNPANGVFSFGKACWVTAAWAVIPFVAAGVLLRRRDA